MEQWKDIDGHVGYQVSDHGQVRSFKNGRQRKTGKYMFEYADEGVNR